MNTDIRDKQFDCRKDWEESHRRGKIAGGIFIVLAGVLFLLKKSGVEFPYWLLSWKTLLIAAGIVSLIKHGFKRFFGIFPIAIGVIFILTEEYKIPHVGQYVWPVAIILFGLVMIFKPKRKRFHKNWNTGDWANESDSEDYIRSSSVFGGVKKNIVSKNFKGGDVKAVFGGGELNFIQADIKEKAVLEITAVFGGIKLVVPRNWEIQSELNTFCGGIEDNRAIEANVSSEAPKVLLLKGNATFGGIEINSY
ncbi:MAG: LiaF-related protein [Bacteroidota bacterium]|nr:LiaF-related protein [Bacteroidota bacterium]